MTKTASILVVNAGSSSLKLALFRAGREVPQSAPILSEKLERISNHAAAVPRLLEIVASRSDVEVVAVGHRVVHGGPRFSAPRILDTETLEELTRLSALSPEHMPATRPSSSIR